VITVGKAVLLIVLGSMMAATAMYVGRERTAVDTAAIEADYEARVLAREAAHSAYNVIVGRVKRDFEGYRGTESNIEYRDAKYDISAVDSDDNTVVITAIGKYAGYQHKIVGSATRGGTRLLDALTLDGGFADLDFRDDYMISGTDLKLNGTRASGPDVHAILITKSSVFNTVQFESSPDKVVGVGGELDIVSGSTLMDLDALESAILNYSGGSLITATGATTYGAGTLGSVASPKVVRIDGDATLSDSFVGYGVLYVTGNFQIEGNARWNGLVFVNNPAGAAHSLRDGGSILGAAVLRTAMDSGDDDGDDVEECEEGKSKKSDKSDKSAKSDKSEKSEKSAKSEKSEKSAKSDKSKKSAKSAKDCKSKSAKSAKSKKSDKSDKSEKSVKSDKSEKSSTLAFLQFDFARPAYARAPVFEEAVLCHVPPGNPANKHTISVGVSAVAAHLAHGDTEGACPDDISTEEGTEMAVTIRDGFNILYSTEALKMAAELIGALDIGDNTVTVQRIEDRIILDPQVPQD
jgi:hypothetical protein